MGVKQTIDRIRKQLASNTNNIETARQYVRETNITKFPDSFTRVLSHSEKSTIHKQTSNNVATKLQKSSTLKKNSTLPKTSVSEKNLPNTKIVVNKTIINKNKSTQSSKDKSSINITNYSKSDIPSSTKINHNSTSVSKSINVLSTSKTLSDINSFLKEQSRKQTNSIVENSIRLIRNTSEEQSFFKNVDSTDISLKIPHNISRSRSLSPGYKGSFNEKEVTHNQHGKSNLSSLKVILKTRYLDATVFWIKVQNNNITRKFHYKFILISVYRSILITCLLQRFIPNQRQTYL